MILTTSLPDLARDIATGRIAPSELVEACLRRIARHENDVAAWVLVDETGARAAAEQLGEEIRRGACRGPLHGIPIGIKDIIDVAGWPTVAGSPLRRDHRAETDAALVARLREAGAILLGKTVTTQFACFDPPPTRNPWNLAHTPGGSSSGSAAAVAAGMCLAAIGTQTGGSITRPAAYCGVSGCKPTHGRVSLRGVVPISARLDHPGPIARDVAGLAMILDAIAGHDPGDVNSVDRPTDDYSGELNRRDPPRLGLVESFFLENATAEVKAATLSALERLRAAGAVVDTVALPASFSDMKEMHYRIMAHDAFAYHREAFHARSDAYGPCITALLEDGARTSDDEYVSAVQHRRAFSAEMSASLAGLDALVTPATTSTAPASLATTGDPAFNAPWSYSGLPTVSLPCQLAADGMPVSLQFTGPLWGERTLFGVAAWCERRLKFAEGPEMIGADA